MGSRCTYIPRVLHAWTTRECQEDVRELQRLEDESMVSITKSEQRAIDKIVSYLKNCNTKTGSSKVFVIKDDGYWEIMYEGEKFLNGNVQVA